MLTVKLPRCANCGAPVEQQDTGRGLLYVPPEIEYDGDQLEAELIRHMQAPIVDRSAPVILPQLNRETVYVGPCRYCSPRGPRTAAERRRQADLERTLTDLQYKARRPAGIPENVRSITRDGVTIDFAPDTPEAALFADDPPAGPNPSRPDPYVTTGGWAAWRRFRERWTRP